ncbi:mobile mystery protein A [Candidatus Omnitrophota bacterium]
MNYWDRKLIRDQVTKKIEKLQDYNDLGMPASGWIHCIREALGLSMDQLAKKVGIDQSRISRLENAEKKGDLKMSSLKKIAHGLGMSFVYGFVPQNTLEQMVRDQARKIAEEKMKHLDHTMALELQHLSVEDREKALDHMIDKILIEEPKDFWDR